MSFPALRENEVSDGARVELVSHPARFFL
jgi:hypothetical protein